MSIIIPANTLAAGGFDVDNSVRFNDGDSAYMHKTAAAGSRRIFTFSTWFKRGQLGTNQQLFNSYSAANAGGFAYMQLEAIESGVVGDRISLEVYGTILLKTTQVLRDPSSWYHLVIAVDTTSGTANNRCRMYLNGTEITNFVTRNNPDQNFDFAFNQNNIDMYLGSNNYGGNKGNYFDGYMAEVVWIDGTQYAASDFGEFDEDSNIWKPIDVSGLTFGTNGFYLDFKASGNLGNDANGGTDLTEVNLAATDQSTDTCTTNFSTLNPLGGSLPLATFSDGNLTLASTTTTYQSAIGTIAIPTTGNWYWEYKVLQTTNGSSGEGFIGAALESSYNASSNPQKLDADGIVIEISGVSGGSNFDAGDIASVEVDRTNNTLKIFKNGSSTASLTKTSLPNEIIFSHVTCFGSGTASVSANFGSPPYAISSGNQDGNGYGNFEYAVPSGYFSLNTKNLAEFG